MSGFVMRLLRFICASFFGISFLRSLILLFQVFWGLCLEVTRLLRVVASTFW